MIAEGARLAQLSDLEAATQVLNSVRAEQADHRGGELFQLREGSSAKDSLADAVTSGRAVVGTFEEVVFGCGLFRIEELADGSLLGVIEAIAVDPEARGVGIGEAMMNLLIGLLTEAGCRGVDSTALPGDRSTKNFFESFGLKARMLTVHRVL